MTDNGPSVRLVGFPAPEALEWTQLAQRRGWQCVAHGFKGTVDLVVLLAPSGATLSLADLAVTSGQAGEQLCVLCPEPPPTNLITSTEAAGVVFLPWPVTCEWVLGCCGVGRARYAAESGNNLAPQAAPAQAIDQSPPMPGSSSAPDLLRSSLDAANMLLWTLSASTGTLEFLGPVQRLLGLGEVTSLRELRAMLLPDDSKQVLAAYSQAMKNGGAVSIEHPILLADGQVRWVFWQVSAADIDWPDAPDRRGLLIDITARKTAQAQVDQIDRLQRLAADSAGLNVFEVDLETGNRKGSELDLRLFGASPDRLDEVFQRIHPEDRSEVRRRWSVSKATGQPYASEFRVLDQTGRYRWVNARGHVTINSNSGNQVMVGVVLDIEERKQLESALREAARVAEDASLAKSAFLASMSHEIRTPLNAIIGYADLLTHSNLGPALDEYVQTLRTSSRHLLVLVNDILDFSRIEAGEMPLESVAFDPELCVEEALDGLAPLAESADLRLALTSRVPLGSRVVGDPGRIRQIAINLLSNAVKFTRQGGVNCRLSLGVEGLIGNLVLEVEDSGIGMDRETVDRLFQPFRQGDASTTRRYGGTGLGLSICQSLARLMCGTLSVRSTPQKGSCFALSLRLPMAQATERVAESESMSVTVAVAVKSAFLRDALLEQFTASGVQAFCLAESPPEDGDPCVDAIVAGCNLIVAWSERLARIRTAAGKRAPIVALAPLGVDTCPVAGLENAYFPISRVLKPSGLRAALELAVSPTVPQRDDEASVRGSDERQLRRLRILVAEDNPVNQALMRIQLETSGHEVVMASDGDMAIRELSRGDFDAVLMDVEMPVMDGLQATRRIRELDDQSLSSVPVIGVTAHVTVDMVERIRQAGMDSYLSKPVMLDRLLEVLTDACNDQGP